MPWRYTFGLFAAHCHHYEYGPVYDNSEQHVKEISWFGTYHELRRLHRGIRIFNIHYVAGYHKIVTAHRRRIALSRRYNTGITSRMQQRHGIQARRTHTRESFSGNGLSLKTLASLATVLTERYVIRRTYANGYRRHTPRHVIMMMSDDIMAILRPPLTLVNIERYVGASVVTLDIRVYDNGENSNGAMMVTRYAMRLR